MKKTILGALFIGMLNIANVCSAAWIHMGDYTVNQNFANSVERFADYVRLIDNLSPKPYNWQGTYFRLEYSDNNVELSRFGEGNSLVSLKVNTRLIPMNPNNTPALDRYGVVCNRLSIAPKGIYGVSSIEHGIIDFPPKVPSSTVRYHSANYVSLGVLKRYSPIESVAQRFSNEIVGTNDY